MAERTEAARELGLLDEHGRVPRDPITQAKLAKAIQRAQAEAQEIADAPPAPETTVSILGRFRAELLAHPSLKSASLIDALTVEAARHTLRTAGLNTEPQQEENRDHE